MCAWLNEYHSLMRIILGFGFIWQYIIYLYMRVIYWYYQKFYVNILALYRRAIKSHKLQCTYMNLLINQRSNLISYNAGACMNLLILINLMWLITHSLPYQSSLVYNNQMDFANACSRPCVHGVSASIYDWQFSIITWCACISKCPRTSIISS